MKTNNNKNTRKIKNNNPRSSPKAVKLTSQALASVRVPIPKALRVASPIPSRFNSKLKLKIFNVLQDAVESFKILVFKANDWYSPNASVVTPGSLTGFQMLSMGYSLWKVTHVRFKYNIVANEPAHGVSHAMGLTDTDPSTITTLVGASALVGRAPVTELNVTGQTTGDSVYDSPWYDIDLASVVGSPIEFLGSQSFSGVGGSAPASPTQLLYIYIVVFNMLNAALTNGADTLVEIEYKGYFYSVANAF